VPLSVRPPDLQRLRCDVEEIPMNDRRGHQHVMVGVDGSDDALRAVRWGADEAARLGVPLRLVTAFAWDDRSAGPAIERRFREALRQTAEGHIAAAAAAAREAVPGVAVERQVAAGSPIEVLGSESRYAQLLVLGDRGLSRVEGLLAGSVAVAVAARGACPVVVVRDGAQDVRAVTAGPVVVGVDGSSTSEAATEFAFEAAAARRVPLVAVHTWWDLVAGPALAALLDLDAIELEERRRLSQRLAGWSEKYPEVRVEQSVSRGHPAQVLIQLSARAQLLVVGSRGRGELAGLVLGSVSNAVVHRARCPVAVVRPRSSDRV
jgi:nucleotide-binding universal stress UspA family protein